MTTRYLITGGCGFIGVNLIELLLEQTDGEIRAAAWEGDDPQSC